VVPRNTSTSYIITQYNTIQWKSLTWTRKLTIQLYLAHVARKKRNKNKQTQDLFNTVQVKMREGSPEGIRVTMEERICERDEF